MIGALSIGGVALGQSALIVDPWGDQSADTAQLPVEAVAQGVAPRADERAWARQTGESPAARPVLDPWKAARPLPVVHRWTSPARLAVSERPPAPLAARAPVSSDSWATVVTDIVDPWAPGPIAARTDPAIVDPWAP